MAKARLDEGTFQGPIIPIGLIPEEPSVRVRAKRTIEEETKFFQLPPPEARPAALPAAGEATSSSTEAAPSPPPEAAIPPVETDTVRTAADVLSQHVGETPLGVPEWWALADDFMKVATTADLRPSDAAAYERVSREGMSVCTKCRFLTGCYRCSEPHAWSYYCRMTLWYSIESSLRPAAKPKGRPRKH